jgi:hypothetical protein
MSQLDNGDPKMKRTMRNALILLGAFLLGLLPPLVQTMRLKSELASTQARIELAETRELAALSYLEVSRNNFGVAAQHATNLFDRLGTLSSSAEEPVRSVAAEAAQKRDTVMRLLATADPGARTELQQMTSDLLAAGDAAGTRARTKD